MSYERENMEDLIFSANVVLPSFIMIALGWFVARLKLFDGGFIKTASKVSFNVFLPILLFYNIATSDPETSFDAGLSAYAVGAVVATFLILVVIIPIIVKQPERKSVVIQALFRSNFLIFAVPMCEVIYGAEGTAVASVLAAFVIPTFNILAVIILTIYDKTKKRSFLSILIRIIKNPLIIASFLGILCLVFGIEFTLASIESVTSSTESVIDLLIFFL